MIVAGLLDSSIAGAVATLVLIASVVAVYLVTKSKRVEASVDVLGKLVDTLSTGNDELRALIKDKEQAHQMERAACQKEIATLQGKVEVLTTNIADGIASAVISAVALRTSQAQVAVLEDREQRTQGDST